ncbi:MAG: sugar ABC transporter ATP-binding protein [Spirochaetia bacterium]|nr:sugar ABC transporter ATP-binding protein [Spirochaetia bacterium]
MSDTASLEQTTDYILELKGISKRFQQTQALHNIDFDLIPGEVHALVGENGAGKSTLIKTISGAYHPDSGTIFFNGEQVVFDRPIAAQNRGISVVYQEFNLVPQLSVADNIFLRHQPVTGTFVKRLDKQYMMTRSREILKELGVHIDPKALVKNISVAYKQLVEIAKSLVWDCKVLILDEPTAVITTEETVLLFEIIRKLQQKGVSIIYISHRLEEIFKIADRITVFRDGEKITTLDVRRDPVTIDQLISHMVGRSLNEQYPPCKIPAGEELLKVESLGYGKLFHDISFSVHAGEILGISGLVGAGRTEVAKTLFGVTPGQEGRIWVNGREVSITSPEQAIGLGISLVPEDRKSEGLIQMFSIKNNLILASQKTYTRGGVFQPQMIIQKCQNMVKAMNIRTSGIEKQVSQLSGGNQQKVVIAKWLLAEAKIIIFDEPTRGIDVGAKVEVYRLMNELKKSGAAIIMISSELNEILGMSDRIMVMHEGTKSCELVNDQVSQETIMRHASGVREVTV